MANALQNVLSKVGSFLQKTPSPASFVQQNILPSVQSYIQAASAPLVMKEQPKPQVKSIPSVQSYLQSIQSFMPQIATKAMNTPVVPIPGLTLSALSNASRTVGKSLQKVNLPEINLPQPVKSGMPIFQLPEQINTYAQSYGGTLADPAAHPLESAMNILQMAGYLKSKPLAASLAEKLKTATNPAEARAIYQTYTEKVLQSGGTTDLKALRAVLNKELVNIIGGTEGNYKLDYKAVQTMKNDTEIGPVIRTIQDGIANIDDVLKNPKAVRPPPVDLRVPFEKPMTYAQKEAKQRLGQLLNYSEDLANMGYSRDQIQKIGIHEARMILEQNIPPFVHETYGPTESEALQAAHQATIAKIGNPTNLFNRIKGVPENVANVYRKWVNTRRSAELGSVIAKEPFRDLDSKGLNGILDFQGGVINPELNKVKDFFNSRYEQLVQSGVDLGYKQNYLPQLWKNTPEEVEKVLGRTLTKKGSISMHALFKDYAEGISKGLKPRFDTVSDLVGWYNKYTSKLLADRTFFEELMKTKMLAPSSRAPQGWKIIDPERFGKTSIKFPSGSIYNGTYSAPEEVANLINNYLKEPATELSGMANVASTTKNIMLTAGIPKTAWNAHGINTLRRNVLSANNPISAFIRGVHWMTNPSAAGEFVKQNMDDAYYFAKHGLTISTEDHAFAPMAEEARTLGAKAYQKYEQIWKPMFDDPLFQKVLPAYKISYARQVFDNLKKFIPEEDAARKASETANNVFGGINVDALGRSKDFQNFLRSVILAPDWAETNIKLGVNTVKGIFNRKSPEYDAYRLIARNLILLRVSEEVLNKVLSGHFMFENEGSHKFEIDTGTKTAQGNTRYIAGAGTAVDFVRVPYQIVTGMYNGDYAVVFKTLRNRFSTLLQPAWTLATNTDWSGRAVYGKDKYGKDIGALQSMKNVAGEIIRPFTPSQFSAGYDLATGKITPEQALVQGLEAPIKYNYPKTVKTAKPFLSTRSGSIPNVRKSTGTGTRATGTRKAKAPKMKKVSYKMPKVKKPKKIRVKKMKTTAFKPLRIS